jgi:3-oxoacyl-[acyl-carrier-protein] synthase II
MGATWTKGARGNSRKAWSMIMQNDRVRVVVTGLGAITALGLSARDTWRALVEGRSGIVRGTQFETDDFPIKIMAEVQDFEPRQYMSAREARRMSRFSQFAVAAAREALDDAKLNEASGQVAAAVSGVDPSRCGVVLGTCVGGFIEIRDATQLLLEKGPQRLRPTFIPRMMHNAPAANISQQFGIIGYNSTTSTACAASAQAIGDAAEVIRRGKADVMVTGGTEAAISDVGQAGFWATRAMTASHNDDPASASRPFDLQRDGLVIGEGAACLVLERLEHALSRSATIYAEVLGFGCSADAYHLTAPDPNGNGASRAMQWALEDAGVEPDDVDYISAHATSTPLGDAIETVAIKRVFGESAYGIPVSAAKSMLGHAIGASGAIEAMASIFSIRDNLIHPTLNYDTPDPACDLDYVPNIAREASVDLVLSNSFGMGGQNAALVFGRV